MQYPTPEVYNGTIYVAMGPNGPTRVYALSQDTGNVIWNTTIKTTSRQIWNSPIVYNGLVYVGVAGDLQNQEVNASAIGGLFALNAQTGNVVWSFNTMIGNTGGAAVWGSVVVDPKLNSIYFGTGNPYNPGTNSLYGYAIMSLNATTGKMNWYYRIYNSFAIGHDEDFGSTPNLFSLKLNNTTYNAIGLGNKNGIYYILDRNNGQLLQKVPILNPDYSSIIGLAGLTYQSNSTNPELFIPAGYNSKTGMVEAFFPSNNTIAWKFNTTGVTVVPVTVVPGAVLFGDDAGDLYAVNTTSGSLLYHIKLPDSVEGGATVADGHVIVPISSVDELGDSEGPEGVIAFSTGPKPQKVNIINFTVLQMIQTLKNAGFTNITTAQNIATISPPAVIFKVFDSNAPGSGKTQLVFALPPYYYTFQGWNSTNPTVYSYTNLTGIMKTGTITYIGVNSSFVGEGEVNFGAASPTT